MANYHSVRSKAKTSFTEDGSLMNDYLVRSMEQSTAQHLKDAVLLTVTIQVSSVSPSTPSPSGFWFQAEPFISCWVIGQCWTFSSQ
ncbi:hypothetical protein U0070_009709 [Myodes glareolus]|uniref:Uncharacterized protein n=1 Tax=Myodes glareolus TaxID=447135 RepID=A0AAW0JFF1_MYOGA